MGLVSSHLMVISIIIIINNIIITQKDLQQHDYHLSEDGFIFVVLIF